MFSFDQISLQISHIFRISEHRNDTLIFKRFGELSVRYDLNKPVEIADINLASVKSHMRQTDQLEHNIPRRKTLGPLGQVSL